MKGKVKLNNIGKSAAKILLYLTFLNFYVIIKVKRGFMKNIIINNEQTTYWIDEKGEILNKKTGNYYKGTIRNSYKYYDLRWKNKKYSFSQHRLLAIYYLENDNPEIKTYVHHKNSDKLDNRLENLEWVSPSENNYIINRKKDINLSISFPEEKEAKWEPFRNTIFLVSNFGQVKNTLTKKILKGKINLGGYREYNLKYEGKLHSHLASRLVAEVFLDLERENNLVVNHKNGNKLNNWVGNLEIISYSENNFHGLYILNCKNLKKVGQYDLEGNLIQIFLSCAEAARNQKISPQSINMAIHKNYTSCGFKWKYIEE